MVNNNSILKLKIRFLRSIKKTIKTMNHRIQKKKQLGGGGKNKNIRKKKICFINN